jgi:hypothetical protein
MSPSVVWGLAFYMIRTGANVVFRVGTHHVETIPGSWA